MIAFPRLHGSAHPQTEAVAGFQVHGYRFQVATRSDLALELLCQLYGEFLWDEPEEDDTSPPETFHLTQRATGPDRVWEVGIDERPLVSHPRLGSALNALEFEICTRVIAGRPESIALHGALLACPGGAALISGASGAGKSTLALALSARGYAIGSDDISFLEPSSGAVRPLPRCFHLDARSRRLLRRQGLALPAIPARHGFVTPSLLGFRRFPAQRLRRVVMLRRGEERLPRLEPVTQAEMTTLLLDQSVWGQHTAPQMLAALSRVTAGASCYRLTGGGLHATADVVAELLERPDR